MKTIANKKDLISEGDRAPAFTLPGAGLEKISLSKFKGKKVVLYFYPKDDTSGCTKESLEFSGLKDKFARAGTVVIGLSPDPVVKHVKFQEKYNLSQPLASDESKETLLAYGVWIEKSMYGRKYMGEMRRLAVELRERTAKAAQQHYRKTKGLISHLSCSSPIFIFIWVVM